MRKVLLSVLLALCLAVPAQAGNLTVSAAASLTDAFNAIKADFDKQNTGVNLTMGDALLNVGEAAIFGITGDKFKIRQFRALNDILAASGHENPLTDLDFESIWGTRSGCRIGRVHGVPDNGGRNRGPCVPRCAGPHRPR